MRNFLSIEDVTDVKALLKKALHYKANPLVDKTLGTNKRVGLLFLNPSMRTRLSTQIAASNLGMETIVFNVGQEGWMLEFEEEVVLEETVLSTPLKEVRGNTTLLEVSTARSGP